MHQARLIMSWGYVSRTLQYFRMSFHLLIINHEILERVIQKFFGIPIFGIWKTYPVFIPVNGCLKWHFVIQNVINLILWCLLNNKNQVLNNILGDLTNYIWSFTNGCIFQITRILASKKLLCIDFKWVLILTLLLHNIYSGLSNYKTTVYDLNLNFKNCKI